MSKKRVEDKFSSDIDAYFNGIEENNKLESKEYKELLGLAKTLSDKDFSRSSNKEAIYKKTLRNINSYKGDNTMKKSNKIKRTAAIAASVVITSGVLMQTTFAKGVVNKIINSISLGHISVVQTESDKREKLDVPKELKGKIFDKDGKPIEVITRGNTDKIYTSKGEEIDSISNGKIITVDERKKMHKKSILEVRDSSKLNEYTCFKVILPSYLPEGYKFNRAELYRKGDEAQVKNSKYINLYFNNEKTGKEIYMQQRFADEETGYTTGTDGKIEKVKVNGVDAVICDDRNIDWEVNGTLYSLSSKGVVGKSELIKIAESIK